MTFTSVAGDGCGMSSRRVEAMRSGDVRESVGVVGVGTGRRMFERDCWVDIIRGSRVHDIRELTMRVRKMQ